LWDRETPKVVFGLKEKRGRKRKLEGKSFLLFGCERNKEEEIE